MISGRFELVGKGPDDSDSMCLSALDELFATAIGSLVAPVSCGDAVGIERVPGTWRWMIDFESVFPNVQDAVIQNLRILTYKTGHDNALLPSDRLRVIDDVPSDYRNTWNNFCLLAMLTGTVTLEVDLPGSTDGIERFMLPNSFRDVVMVQDYQVIPFSESFDCIVSVDDEDDTRVVLHASTLEKMTALDELEWEFNYVHDSGFSDTDKVKIRAERNGVVVLSDGAVLLHTVYAVQYAVATKRVCVEKANIA